jgi:outer membrane protein TolC
VEAILDRSGAIMKRWKQRLLCMGLAVSGLVGCKHKLFISEKDYDHYRMLGLQMGGPADLDTNQMVTVAPGRYDTPPPKTVDTPNRQPRNISLEEALAIALEQGNTGSQSLQFPGISNENLQTGVTDAVRVLRLDPAVSGAQIESALARFDVLWSSSMSWTKNDEAVVNTFASNGDAASFNTGLYKALPAGGVAGITFATDYQKFDLNNVNAGFFRFNSAYKPRLRFGLEQPLLQGYGVEINQLLPTHPGSFGIINLTQAGPLANAVQPSGQGREGILISRVRFDQSNAEFERNINFLLLNVEYAYWNLYASYGALYATDKALVDAYGLYKVIRERTKGSIQPPMDEKRTLAQLEDFRAQRYSALGAVIENERQLRSLLGMKDDMTRLVPADVPVRAPYMANWTEALNEALNNRPELVLSRQDLKLRQFDVLVAKNLLQPDLRAFANYDINGIGERLDGSSTFTTVDQFGNPVANPHNALANFTADKFNNWSIGLRYNVPIGFRDAHAATRIARLNLLRSYAALQDNERKVIKQMENQYSRLVQFQRTMQAQHAKYLAARDWYDITLKRMPIAQDLSVLVEQLLSAQQNVAAALTAEYRAEADYNNTLAAWQFAKGTIMQYDNINIASGPLPEAAQIRATDHFRERNNALLMRERPAGENGPAATLPLELDPLYNVLPPPQAEAPQSVPQMMQSLPQPAGSINGQATPLQPVPNSPVPMQPMQPMPMRPMNPVSPSATGLAPKPPWLGSGVAPAAGTSSPSPYSGIR